MTELRDIVSIDHGSRPPAIRLDDGLAGGASDLIDAFTPTRSSITILRHLQRVVLPDVHKGRAMVWHGVYGSGKSHLGVLIGHLLGHGSGGAQMGRFLDRLANQGESGLRREIESTFLPADDPDARPYLVVPIYASDAPTLQSSLLEALYQAIESTDELDPASILPKTEYAAASERLWMILEHHPEYRSRPFSEWGIHCAAFNPDELDTQLQSVSPDALDAFKQWHPRVSAGALFDPQDYGGKKVVDAYLEAAGVLARDHGYKGIAVIWDEFGYAIETMIAQPQRHQIDEIQALQNFVEVTCTPSHTHTLFIALTHRSLREYGVTAQATETVIHRLETIEGRFTQIPVELKASEAEGYHLLGALIAPTEIGRGYLHQAVPRAKSLAQVCSRIPLFHSLATDILAIVEGCYPLHPVTAAGLFAIASHGVYAQANRTVFTFFDNLRAQSETDVFDAPVDLDALYGGELIRLPALMDVYRKEIYDEYPDLADGYRDAVAKVKQGFTDPRPKQDILTLLLLSRVLGNDFQPTDAFLAAALYDQDSPPAGLLRDLEDLSNAGLIWRRQAETPVWELEGGGGTQIGGLIEEEEAKLPTRSFAEMLINDAELLEDLLPQCGIHDLEPSPAGIIRSFRVDLVEGLATRKIVELPREGLSAQVFFALPASDLQAGEQSRQIDEMEAPGVPTYLWMPSRGLSDLLDDLRRYRAILNLVQRAALGDGPRRQLQNKADEVRAGLRKALNERLGRQALRQRDVSIRRLDDPEEVVTPQSWHGFVDHLEQQICKACSKEVQVRAMNANRLYVPDGERRIRGIEKLLQSILEFDDLPASQRDDLFGEVETSELAALIDGTLGVYTNGLMIERASGWDLKTPDEADGPIGEVLRLIRDRLLDKRKKVHDIADLRAELVRPPYGLPFSVMPILAAVAIRKDHTRLKWVNKQGTFSSLLWSAFTPNGDGFKLRFDTFPPKQREVLEALRDALGMQDRPGAAQDPDERAREAVKELRSYHAELPKELKQSSKLPDETKRLFDLLKRPGQDDQEVAKLLCELVQSADGAHQQRDQLREIVVNAVNRIVNEREAVVREIVDKFSRDPEKWQRIRQTLVDHDDEALAVAIARVHANQADGFDRLAMSLLNKHFAECSDIEVGKLGGELGAILEAILRPPPPPPPSPSGGSSTTGRDATGPDGTSITEAPAAAFRRELTQLVARYRTELSSDELREIAASITAAQSAESVAEGAGG